MTGKYNISREHDVLIKQTMLQILVIEACYPLYITIGKILIDDNRYLINNN